MRKSRFTSEQLLATEAYLAALERKVGQLTTMERELLKAGLIAAPVMSSASSSIISGPAVPVPSEDGAKSGCCASPTICGRASCPKAVEEHPTSRRPEQATSRSGH